MKEILHDRIEAPELIRRHIAGNDFPKTPEEFGKLMRAFLLRAGKTRDEIKEQTGIGLATLAGYFKGTKVPKESTLLAFLEVTKLPEADPEEIKKEFSWMKEARAQVDPELCSAREAADLIDKHMGRTEHGTDESQRKPPQTLWEFSDLMEAFFLRSGKALGGFAAEVGIGAPLVRAYLHGMISIPAPKVEPLLKAANASPEEIEFMKAARAALPARLGHLGSLSESPNSGQIRC